MNNLAPMKNCPGGGGGGGGVQGNLNWMPGYIQKVLIPVIFRPPFRIFINQTIKKLLMILALRCTILHNQVVSYTKEWSKWYI